MRQLAQWQWSLYAEGHQDRRNLVIHLLTVPLFVVGTVCLLVAPLLSWWLAFGALLLPLAMAAQGRGHQLERTPPVPFRGPADALSRIFVEQWFTFWRYFWSGQLLDAWRKR